MNKGGAMNIVLTDHARKRFRQRGIKGEIVTYLYKYGKISFATGGATRVDLTRRNKKKILNELKKEMQWIEKASRVLIIEKDGHILTGYHKN